MFIIIVMTFTIYVCRDMQCFGRSVVYHAVDHNFACFLFVMFIRDRSTRFMMNVLFGFTSMSIYGC